MIYTRPFAYRPNESEREKAANSYLMSVVAVIAGLPLPIINLIATFFFWLSHRKDSFFVRWHSLQSLLSQVILLGINSYSFWWTVSIFLLQDGDKITNHYIAYMIMVFIVNVIEFVFTIYTAVKVRKGIHVEWWLFGDLTNLICKK